MAVTGLILVAFLLVHMFGNLKMFMGAEAYNEYAEWLKQEVGHPFLPYGWFIWIFRFGLLASVVLHMYSAITLWLRAKEASPATYEAKKKLAQTYSARTMRWGGVILAIGLIWHLTQFTIAPTNPQNAYLSVIEAFQHWWFVLIYAAWMVTVCMHIRHGFWSAFTTLGANTSPKARVVLNGCAWVVALLLYIGFMIMPVAVLTGVLTGVQA